YQDGRKHDDPPPAGGPRPTPVGADTFHSAAGAGWARNFLAYRGAAVYGGNQGRTMLEREQAHALALDAARHLGFLTDPRFLPDAVTASGGVADQVRRLDAAMGQSEKFLRLVDAYLIGQKEGHELYAVRMDRRAGGYFSAMVGDVDKLARLRALDVLSEADVAKLEKLVALRARGPEAWNAIGGRNQSGVTEALGLLQWMRDKSADLVASTSQQWTINHERLGPLGTPGERTRSRASFKTIARIAMEAHMRGGQGEMALLAPPVDVAGTDARPIAFEAHRTRLREAMTRTLEQRAAVAKTQAAAREKIVAGYQGQPLDDELRAKLEKQLADAMRKAEVSVTRKTRQSAREWILYAGLMGVEQKR
ncbi:MAG: hypothetical protein OER88_10590, partial [Planctomycetota bacterium]|nr:hypothetical protein [Planctomycetota bacterium]